MSSPEEKPTTPTRPGLTPLGIVLMSLFFIIIIITAIVCLAAPMVLRSAIRSDLTQSVNNARMVGMALAEFDTEYGRFPDAQTAVEVASRTRSNLAPPGTTANDHLRQLLAAGIINSEQAFYTKTAFTRQPDNVFDTPDTALASGEVGFGYILNGVTALGTTGTNPSIPILCAPLAFDGTSVSPTRFDAPYTDGLSILLRIDMAATSHRIDPSTGDLLLDGKPWLATGGDTPWGSEITPRVATPIPK
jgi:hypothetical protein